MSLNPTGLAFAILTERSQWNTQNHAPLVEACVTLALDRLARDIAVGLHPDVRTGFLLRAGVTMTEGENEAPV